MHRTNGISKTYRSFKKCNCSIALRGRFELPLPVWRTGSQGANYQERFEVTKPQLKRYLSTRELSGLSENWMRDMSRSLSNYLGYLDWTITEDKSIEYFKTLKEKYSNTNYRRNLYQIRKFLFYLEIDWAKNIKPPAELEYIPKRVSIEDIHNTLSYFEKYSLSPKLKALVLLGATSGLRSEELYQINLQDIDMDGRIVYVNHNPDNGQTTKTKKSRMSFFTEDTKKAILEYINQESINSNDILFSRRQCQNYFANAPIRVKQLRKFFSQEWDRRGGPTSIKKILMGHSLKGDVDLMHYNCQSEEDLKLIYDKVMYK